MHLMEIKIYNEQKIVSMLKMSEYKNAPGRIRTYNLLIRSQ